jgi:gamma-glutamylputrescine oxidase
MEYQNRWYLSLLQVDGALDICKPLEEDIATEYVVMGGGVAWLHAALTLAEKKCKVVLIEKSICGGWMSGRSGWFLTPDSELGLRQIEARYGTALAKKIWHFGEQGQQSIVTNAKQHAFVCDLRQQDSLLLGLGNAGRKAVMEEFQERKAFGLPAQLIHKQQLHEHNTWEPYTNGVRYTDCYSINPMQYCQALKLQLLKMGVRIYEFTHVHKLDRHILHTNLWSVTFKQAIICPGKAESSLFPQQSSHTYGVQNYIALSEPLSNAQIASMMPSGECMCWDTQLIFTYYRLTWDRRIVLWWGNAVVSFQPRHIIQPLSIGSVIGDFKRTFPALRDIEFPHYWSGRIQASKDLMPLVGREKRFSNHVRVQGAVGLPWAAWCGTFASQLLHEEADDDLSQVFSYDRPFFIPRNTNYLIPKALIFGICNAKAMFSQNIL